LFRFIVACGWRHSPAKHDWRPVSRLIVLFLLVLGWGCVPSRRGSAPVNADLVLTRVNVVDVEGGRVLREQTVLIVGNRIVQVAPSRRAANVAGVLVVDARGKYLIPGLWDMHVHLDNDRLARTVYFPLFLANGITGARSMRGDCHSVCAEGVAGEDPHLPISAAMVQRWKREIATGTLPGPRLVAASAMFDGPKPDFPGSYAISSPDEARQRVRLARERGADFIKVYPGLSHESYFAILDEARALGLPVAGHIPFTIPTADVSRAGLRSIEHMDDLLGKAASDAVEDWAELFSILVESYDRTRFADLFAFLAANDTWRVPTLLVERNLFPVLVLGDTTAFTDARLRYVPADIHKPLRAHASSSNTHQLGRNARAPMESFLRLNLELVGEMHRAGVPLLAGTDTPLPFVVPGFSLHEELDLFVQAGLSPLDALRTATLNPARFLEATDSLGTVAPGKLADLVLLDRNPLEDIRHTQRIHAMVVNGRYLDREALDRLLRQAETSANR
jgi:imidazolonepropionase-like amidohydrolase